MSDNSIFPGVCQIAESETQQSSEGGAPVPTGTPSSIDASLSIAHICTHEIEARANFYIDGSLVHVSKSKYTLTSRSGGGKRGNITTMSRQSRQRMMIGLAKVKKTCIPVFVTLTFPDNYPDIIQSKKHFRALVMRMKRKWPKCAIEWKMEPQKRGAVHYHCFVWNVDFYDLRGFIPMNWYEIAGQGDKNHLLFHLGALPKSQHCVQEIRSWNGVMWYAAKYLSKMVEVEGWERPGRFWGIIGREFVPWAELLSVAVTDKVAFQFFRLMRKKMEMKKAYKTRSLRLFCDPAQWVRLLLLFDTK